MTTGSAASGAGDNREIPVEEGGDISKLGKCAFPPLFSICLTRSLHCFLSSISDYPLSTLAAILPSLCSKLFSIHLHFDPRFELTTANPPPLEPLKHATSKAPADLRQSSSCTRKQTQVVMMCNQMYGREARRKGRKLYETEGIKGRKGERRNESGMEKGKEEKADEIVYT